jgi:hypothetical protein
MKTKKVKVSVLLLFILGFTGVYAQQAIPTSGGNTSGSGGSVSYTIGQIVYTTYTGTNGSLAQGIQQPFEFSVVTGLIEAIGINLICATYPNPTKNFVMLKIENYRTDNLTYLLYDSNGKLLENKKVEGSETSIDMCNLVTATYFLKINESNKVLKIYKIIKN